MILCIFMPFKKFKGWPCTGLADLKSSTCKFMMLFKLELLYSIK